VCFRRLILGFSSCVEEGVGRRGLFSRLRFRLRWSSGLAVSSGLVDIAERFVACCSVGKSVAGKCIGLVEVVNGGAPNA